MGHIILMAASYKQVLSHYNIIIMATIIGVKKVTQKAKPCIRFVVEEALETQSNVQGEEEHRKEKNRNYKWESQA